jgi:voltage-gated potassium channel Kch
MKVHRRNRLGFLGRIKKLIIDNGQLLLGCSFVIVTAIGTYGYVLMFQGLEGHSNTGFWDCLYHALQLYTLQFNMPYGVSEPLTFNPYVYFARFAAPILLGSATVYALWRIIKERYYRFRLKRSRDHVIVCGLGRKGMRIIELLEGKKEKIVIIEKDRENGNVETYKSRGIIVLMGNAADESILRQAKIEKAKSVYAITGDDNANIQIAIGAKTILVSPEGDKNHVQPDTCDENTGKRINCYVHLYDNTLKEVFEGADTFQQRYPNYDARIFNVLDESARRVLEEYPPDKAYYDQLSQVGPAAEHDPLHILVVGFGYMGESLVRQIMRVAHYDIASHKVKVIIVDRLVAEKERQFLNLCQKPDKFDIELKFIISDVKDISSLDQIGESFPPTVVYVALGSDNLSIATAVRLRKIFGAQSVPIVVCMTTTLSDSFTMHDARPFEHEDIIPFNIFSDGLIDVSTRHHQLESLAKLAHMQYIGESFWFGDKESDSELIGWCQREKFDDKQLKDKYELKMRSIKKMRKDYRDGREMGEKIRRILFNEAVRCWDDLLEHLRDSNRFQIDHLPIKLRSIGFSLENGDPSQIDEVLKSEDIRKRLAEMEHRRWLGEKYVAGWRYGERDNKMKIHDDYIPFKYLENPDAKKDDDSIILIPELVRRYQEMKAKVVQY